MDVGINLHDLRGSGRLAMFARCVGARSEHEAIGMLADVWAETQDREISWCTEEAFISAVSLRFEEPSRVFTAMKRAQLVVPAETPEVGLGPTLTWLIKGNEKHVAKLQAYRASASAGGKASAARRQATAKRPLGKIPSERQATAQATGAEPAPERSSDGHPTAQAVGFRTSTLVTGILDTGNRDLTSDPDLSQVQDHTSDPRSLVSSDAKNSVGLSAPPSAAADALSVLDIKPPKRKERSPEQKRRSVNNARLYCQLYAEAEGHPPTGLDQSFYGAMAKFSDKHAEGAEQILRWVFQHCPDKGFRTKGWPLPLIIEQAPRLWRELNNPRAAIENLAAPRKQQQLALAANNEVEFDAFLERHGEAR